MKSDIQTFKSEKSIANRYYRLLKADNMYTMGYFITDNKLAIY